VAQVVASCHTLLRDVQRVDEPPGKLRAVELDCHQGARAERVVLELEYRPELFSADRSWSDRLVGRQKVVGVRRVGARRSASRCEPGSLTGTIVDLDNDRGPAAFTTVAATGGDDRRVISRSGDVPLFELVDQAVTDARGVFELHALAPARRRLSVFFFDPLGDRMLEFDGPIPEPRCSALRFGIHGRARNDDQTPLPLVPLAP